MELKVIEDLLEKYLEGETSVKEEEQLKEYFTSGEVAPHLEAYRPMFGYFAQAKTQRFSGKVTYSSGRRKVYSWVAVAASILILLGVVTQQDNPSHEFGTYEDPELALQETKEALKMISRYMNTGTEELAYIEEFNSAKNKIVKNP